MQPAQIILILFALAVAGGGVVMLVKGATRYTGGTPRPYLPLGVIAVGLIVAYQAVTAYERLSPTDIALLFLFVFALALFVGLRFFVVDRYERLATAEPDATPPVEHQATESGVEQTEGQESDTSPDEEERPA